MTELAYLRDAMVRGLVDDAGLAREKVLLQRVRELRPRAITQPEGRAAYPALPRRRRAAVADYPQPSFPGPAGLAATTRPRPRVGPRRPAPPWGRLLPSTPRSTPTGSPRVRD